MEKRTISNEFDKPLFESDFLNGEKIINFNLIYKIKLNKIFICK